MKLYVTLYGVLLSTSLVYVLSNAEPYNFQYKYMVIANSYTFDDEKYAFKVKEHLILKYEKLCLDLESKYHQDVIKIHIDEFEFDKDINSYYSRGMIVLRIGSGLGYTFKGSLRKNSCEDYVINEKFYFFELFS